MAAAVFGLPPFQTHLAVLLAALPTGIGPFMLAEFYRWEAEMTSAVILTTTAVSVVTLSGYLAWIGS
jgi:predicted permease